MFATTLATKSEAIENSYFYLHEQKSDYETRALAVANLPVKERIGFHHIEETLLSQAIFLLEKVVLWVGPGNVPPDDFFAGRRRLDEVSILFFNRGVMGATQKRPHYSAEMVLDSLAH